MIKSAKFKFVAAMLIFGSIGIVVKNIGLPSPAIVQWRTIIGSLFLLLVFLIRKEKIDVEGVKANLFMLLIGGVVLGGGWAFLFEAYNHTTVGMATMVYYSAPIIVFFLSPLVFKEKVTVRQIAGITMAIFGMIIVNVLGVEGGKLSIGVVYGLISALLYAGIMIINKFIRGLSSLESTWVQLMIAAVVMTTYVFMTTGQMIHLPQGKDIGLVLIVGVLHTGIATYLYFSNMQKLPGQTIAILSYIDPASALLFALVFLGERLSVYQLVGAALIFGGTIFSQMTKSADLQ